MSSARPCVTKRACDGCKIRKIRCGGGQPCRSCTKAGIKCTYVRVQQCRGPRRLRSTTQYLIEQAQSNGESHDYSAPRGSDIIVEKLSFNTLPVRPSDESESPRISVVALTSPLSIYHVRMYPVWPIVNVEDIVYTLQQDTDSKDHGTYALATALAAATITQLRLEQGPSSGESLTAEKLAAESLRARDLCNYRLDATLNGIRTSFFLHVYYENQKSGGSESLLYLREAISMAQMMGLHREASYSGLSFEERQLRRRIIWLLFVTERGVCILHRFPVALKTNISPPEIDEHDQSQVLPAFLKLLSLFQNFEKSGMFDIIQDENSEIQPGTNRAGHVDWPFLESLQRNLQDGSMLFDHISDVQKADLCVTRHWMRMVLWKLSPKRSFTSSPSTESMSPHFPVSVAKELVGIVSQLPRSAIEAHGLGMELKIYEVANSLADAISSRAMLPLSPEWDGGNRPNYILFQLHSILSTFRGGGNKKLVDILYRKMADAQLIAGPALSGGIRTSERKPRVSGTRRASSEEHEARANNDQNANQNPELTNHEPMPGGSGYQYPDTVDPLPLAFQFDAHDLAFASTQDAGYHDHGPQYSGGTDLFGSVYDGTTSELSQFLLDSSSVAIASEAVQTLSPIWSSLMPMNATSDDLNSHILRATTQDFLFPEPDFTARSTNNDFVGLY